MEELHTTSSSLSWLLVLILLDCAELVFDQVIYVRRIAAFIVFDCHVSAKVLETVGTEWRERVQNGASQTGSQDATCAREHLVFRVASGISSV